MLEDLYTYCESPIENLDVKNKASAYEYLIKRWCFISKGLILSCRFTPIISKEVENHMQCLVCSSVNPTLSIIALSSFESRTALPFIPITTS